MKPERPAMASTLLLSALLRVTADGPSLTICNPAVTPVKYLKMSNGGPISSPSCSASWDLHEVEFFDQHGNQIFATADTTTGSSWRGTALPSNTLDGDLSSYWAGDHDHGLSCSCWSDEKMDVQAIDFTLPEESYLSRIEVYQGHNEWTMLQLRLKCAGANGVYGSAMEGRQYQPLSECLRSISCLLLAAARLVEMTGSHVVQQGPTLVVWV
ncbi:unnamed protein product [Cladocopium goreaui]|uniref:Uncharacterized protein n=1 Tax=Cladocopium goreaui TaxID=2562237 RepID=A0A9P1M243_9DINO|nr:unnamed protein product [Cladocopium goreaui]